MKLRFLPMLTVAALAFSASASATPVLFYADMSGDQLQPDVTTPARGFSTLWLDDQTNRITVSMLADGFSSPETMVEIYGPAVPGQNASGFLSLPLGNFDNRTFTITSEQSDWIMNNLTYVIVSTVSNPAGEIRGQYVAAAPEPAALASVVSGLCAALFLRRRRR